MFFTCFSDEVFVLFLYFLFFGGVLALEMTHFWQVSRWRLRRFSIMDYDFLHFFLSLCFIFTFFVLFSLSEPWFLFCVNHAWPMRELLLMSCGSLNNAQLLLEPWEIVMSINLVVELSLIIHKHWIWQQVEPWKIII